MKDFYKTLGVETGADFQQIRDAYRSLSKRYHPDLNGGDAASEEKFKDVLEAYSILKDPYKRKEFDRRLERYKEASRPAANNRPSSRPSNHIRRRVARSKSSAAQKKNSRENLKKDLYMGGGIILFLISAITILVSLEKSFYLKESYLETIEETNKIQAIDSMNLIQGFKPDSVYTSGAAMKTTSQ